MVLPPDGHQKNSAVLAALEALTPEQWLKLNRYAELKMLGLRGKVRDQDAGDLLHAAIERTLVGEEKHATEKGARRWNHSVDFFTHLIGCMRSIANGWLGKTARFLELLPEAVITEVQPAPFERDALFAQSFVRSLLRDAADNLAESVLDLILQGYSSVEIQQKLDIDGNGYNAAKKRILRAAHRFVRRKK
jgi:hypothetical protein